jgi:murein DD-endopeptidase MepM/ murein hydrolase activator NlpD
VKKIICIFAGVFVLGLTACDLQPKIMALPDTVGDFISVRYPALLADPDVQPEIYNSAATDYGTYAAPELYSNGAVVNDYVLYASVDDYIVPPQPESEEPVAADSQGTTDVSVDSNMIVWSQDADVSAEKKADATEQINDAKADDYLVVPMYGPVKKLDVNQIVVARGDTVYSLAKRYSTSPNNIIEMNGLKSPYTLQIGQKLNVPAVPNDGAVVDKKENKTEEVPNVISVPEKKATGVQTTTKVQLTDVVVQPGDTLYSISRKYAVPVNDLAVLNNLKAPFALTVGQKLRVPDLKQVSVAKTESKVVSKETAKGTTPVKVAEPVKVADNTKTAETKPSAQKKTEDAKTVAKVKEEPKKISSDPSKKLPAITARSSSKFSWPVKGTVLSHYGAKSNGLFNDGINIGAKVGTVVKAAENGVVAYAGNEVKGMGNLVIIQHDGGWMTVYAHMDSMVVRRGAKVSVGQKIGTVGKTGKVDKPQLHFEIRKGTKAYNPSAYLKK